MIKTEFMELYEELGSLYEATDFYASKEFWADAKEGKLNDLAFKIAFKDELVNLGLWSLIDEEYYSNSRFYIPGHTGALKEKGSYGAIKKAAEENPDSWAVKALLKMWVLQFKDGVKSNSQIKKDEYEEKERIRKAEQDKKDEQARIEREAKYAAASAEQEVLAGKLSFVEDLVNKITAEYIMAKKASVKATLDKSINLRAETSKLTKGIIDFKYRDYEESYLAKIEAKPVGTIVSLPTLHPAFPSAYIHIEITSFLGEAPAFKWRDMHAHNSFSLTVNDITEETIKEKLLKVLDKISDVVIAHITAVTIDSIQKEYDRVLPKITVAKNVQAAVNAGKPADPNFIAEVLGLFENGLKRAKNQANIWSNSTSDNSAVAYNLELHDWVQEACLTLVCCNWRAYTDEKEVAVWRTTDSIEALKEAVYDVFNEFSGDLTIEITK